MNALPSIDTPQPIAAIQRGAHISVCNTYRYSLWRTWSRRLPRIVWVMLNPSVADGNIDDPTIRRCLAFSREWGYGSLTVVNLFAARATDPKQLATFKDPIGPMNDMMLRNICRAGHTTVLAWGAHRAALNRESVVLDNVRHAGQVPQCLGMTKDGHPKHPLYVSTSTPLSRFR